LNKGAVPILVSANPLVLLKPDKWPADAKQGDKNAVSAAIKYVSSNYEIFIKFWEGQFDEYQLYYALFGPLK